MSTKKSRKGRFVISFECLDDWESLLPFMSKVVVVDARANYATNLVEYTGFSDLSEETECHYAAPLYDVKLSRNEEGLVTVKVVKALSTGGTV